MRSVPALSLFASLLLCSFALLAAPLGAQQVDRDRWSYRYQEKKVFLKPDSARAAVLLAEPGEGERERLAALLAGDDAFLPAAAAEQQGYVGLWLVRFRAGLAEEERLAAIGRLHWRAEVRLASVVLHYGNALAIPKAELLVLLDEDAPAGTLDAVLAAGNLSVIREFPGLAPHYLLAYDGLPHDTFRRARALAALPGVHSAEPSFILHLEPLAVPNDPIFPQMWHHQNTGQTGGTPGADMSSPFGWDVSTGGAGVVIAIIDEGVDYDHEDLAAHMLPGHDSTDQPWPEGVEGNAASSDGHGTATAGIAAAIGNNGIGVTGVNWDAFIVSVRIGYDGHWTEVPWEVDGITWAVDNGADVLSNSWGGGPPSTSVQNAIQYARASGRSGLGCPVFFAAGNWNGSVIYPAAFPESIAVGASSPCDERKSPSSCDGENFWGSCFGPALDLVAPGVLIQTTDIMGGGGYTSGNYDPTFNGTSSACPNAAGAAALLLSVAPLLTHQDVESFLESTADDMVGPPNEDTPGWDQFMGWGRVNIESLMALVGGPNGPTNLTCTEVGSDVLLSWANGESYDSVEIRRDGTVIATLGGSPTSYTDPAPPLGGHSYAVRGIVGGSASIPASCSVFLTGGATDLVWAPADAGGSVAGGGALTAALLANGRAPLQVADLSAISALDDFEQIYANLGIYPDNHVLTDSESQALVGYLSNGVGGASLYMEGGDTWAFDPQLPIHDRFHVDGISDGTGDLAVVIGTGGGACDLSGIDLTYGGENSWIDHLAPLAGASTVQQNSSPGYNVAVFYDEGSYRTIGASHEFGGLFDGASTKADLMAGYLTCLGIALPTNVIAAPNADGAPGQSGISHFVLATSDLDLDGFSFGLDFSENLLAVTDVLLDGTITGAVGAEFFVPDWNNDPGEGWYTVGVVIDISPPVENSIPAGVDQPIMQARFDVSPAAPPGATGLLVPTAGLGNPPVALVFVAGGGVAYTPDVVPGTFTVLAGTLFIRGDANLSGAVDISDGVAILDHLFSGAPADCLDAADANDSGVLDLADGIYVLQHLFNGGPPPPPPFPGAGTDPTADGLDCQVGL